MSQLVHLMQTQDLWVCTRYTLTHGRMHDLDHTCTPIIARHSCKRLVTCVLKIILLRKTNREIFGTLHSKVNYDELPTWILLHWDMCSQIPGHTDANWLDFSWMNTVNRVHTRARVNVNELECEATPTPISKVHSCYCTGSNMSSVFQLAFNGLYYAINLNQCCGTSHWEIPWFTRYCPCLNKQLLTKEYAFAMLVIRSQTVLARSF